MERPVRFIGAGLVVLLILAAAWGWYVTHPGLWPEYRQASTLVAAIEQFRTARGRLPASTSELPLAGISETGPVFYQPTGSDTYEVWFGRWLGESYTYDSSTRSWR